MKIRRALQRKPSVANDTRRHRLEVEVLRLKTQGYTRKAIAEELQIDTRQVNRLWEQAYAEFIIDHRKLRDEKFAEILAGHEAMIRKWLPRADKGDVKAATVVLRCRREISRMCGHGNNVTVEHSGMGGGPILTVNTTPMEAARLVREAFGGKVLPYPGQPTPPSSEDIIDVEADEPSTH